jgi:hypothetical protein
VEERNLILLIKYGKEEKAFDTLVRLVAGALMPLIGVDHASRKPYITCFSSHFFV